MSTGAQAAVRERPTLFSGPMVRAILDGTKTQTRRVVTDATSQGNWKPSQCDLTTAWVDPGPSPAGNPGPYLKAHVTACEDDDGIVDRIYPRWWPGDRLWVRETFVDMRVPERPARDLGILYAADCPPGTPAGVKGGWRPSIFMPRACSRITLELTSVRVERVRDISEADARAEGAAPDTSGLAGHTPYISGFAYLWQTINGVRGYGWDVNPWVWVLEFSRVAP